MNATSRHFATLEKLLEHRFLGDVATALWRRGVHRIEILRSEVDHAGYDVVMEACGVVRHIQLKVRRRGGKRRDVNVNVHLGAKPSGCVVWMDYKDETLELGPFLWFGAAPGEPLPPLGDKLALHSKGNAKGQKLTRPGQRIVKESAFERVSEMGDLVTRLFGLSRSFTGETSLAFLREHIARKSAAFRPGLEAVPWLARVQAGDFGCIPGTVSVEEANELGHLIDGYELSRDVGLPPWETFWEQRSKAAETEGTWTGSALELWVLLFLECRSLRFAGEWDDPAPRLQSLVASLSETLRLESGSPVA
jgi:hypothetical protein